MIELVGAVLGPVDGMKILPPEFMGGGPFFVLGL